jgi:hypothetical protein
MINVFPDVEEAMLLCETTAVKVPGNKCDVYPVQSD